MADEEIIEQEQEPLIIETKGKWQKFEVMTNQTFEVGKTYRITVQGDCLFAISAEKPTAGIGTSEITYTKDNNNILWIKTKGEN